MPSYKVRVKSCEVLEKVFTSDSADTALALADDDNWGPENDWENEEWSEAKVISIENCDDPDDRLDF